jgi:hypothetical protein
MVQTINKNDTKFMFPEIKDIIDKYCVSYETKSYASTRPSYSYLEIALYIKTPIVAQPVKLRLYDKKDNHLKAEPFKNLTALDFAVALENFLNEHGDDDEEEIGYLVKNMMSINENTTIKEILDSLQFKFDILGKLSDNLTNRLLPYCDVDNGNNNYKVQQFRMEVK